MRVRRPAEPQSARRKDTELPWGSRGKAEGARTGRLGRRRPRRPPRALALAHGAWRHGFGPGGRLPGEAGPRGGAGGAAPPPRRKRPRGGGSTSGAAPAAAAQGRHDVAPRLHLRRPVPLQQHVSETPPSPPGRPRPRSPAGPALSVALSRSRSPRSNLDPLTETVSFRCRRPPGGRPRGAPRRCGCAP